MDIAIPDPTIAGFLALCAALAAAVGSVIRQRAAQEVTDEQVGHLQLFGMLVRDFRWWLGGVGDVASYCLLAAALDRGSVMLVTALQVTVLLFALPIYARVTGHRVTGREWVWAVVLVAALAALIKTADPAVGQSRGSLQAWLVVAVIMGPILTLCVLAARRWADRPFAAVLLAAVSGSCLALFAVLTKGVVDVLHQPVGHLLYTPELYAWILAGAAGMIFQQSAFRAGALTASLPTITVAKPVVAVALGATVLKETLEADGPEWVLLIAMVVVVIVATVALARGEAASMSAGAGRDVKHPDLPTASTQQVTD
ncbi:DMT family transporter [Mycobacterium sp. pUA109]|uniref:DMT family transporter n=1 Tax=Mycobacterium sp. pUA109 TaxID=3238982 RepID=UPI00351B2856